MTIPTADIQEIDPSAVITLYELDATVLGGAVTRLHNGTNEVNGNMVWDGDEYSAFPIEVDGFELTNHKVLPRPIMRIANANQIIGALVRTYNDLVGATLTRRRTFWKYLDAVNYTGGVNADADPTIAFNEEVYIISRKSIENKIFMEFELVAPPDFQGLEAPRRQAIKNVCPWIYRGTECSYAGAAVAKVDDTPTSDSALDVCGKRITSCELRFGEGNPLPFGGFPAVGNI